MQNGKRGVGACALGIAVVLSSSRLLAQTADQTTNAEALPPAPPPPAALPSAPSPPAPPAQSLPATVQLPPAPLPPARGSELEPERAWYGWQLMINDFVALGTLGGAAAAGLHDNKAIFAVVIPVALVYDLGGPTIHWLHGRKKIAGLSLGVRVGVPFMGVMIGSAFAGCERGQSSSAQSCRSRGAGYGALFGFAAATAFDAAALAWDAPRGEQNAAAVRLMPLLVPHEGGGEVGVVGRF